MRAFRPGRYAAAVDEEQAEQIKQAKLEVYAVRAKAKLPLFDDDVFIPVELEAEQDDQSEDLL